MFKRITQLQYESGCWKRLLEFIMHENAICKNRLAEVVRIASGTADQLEQAEIYQDYFIQEETLIALVRNDISRFDHLLSGEISEDAMIINEIFYHYRKISREFDKLERAFKRKKAQFNGFIEETIG